VRSDLLRVLVFVFVFVIAIVLLRTVPCITRPQGCRMAAASSRVESTAECGPNCPGPLLDGSGGHLRPPRQHLDFREAARLVGDELVRDNTENPLALRHVRRPTVASASHRDQPATHQILAGMHQVLDDYDQVG
jgi:hypothetical protein